MQHLAHIFIGDGLVSFRDKFAATYRNLHADHEQSLFSAISLTADDENRYILSPDQDGDTLDAAVIAAATRQTDLFNFFEDMYRRKVTVAHPGNHSMVVVVWAKLFLDDNSLIIGELVRAISRCGSNFHIDVAGFTHDAVSCFVPDPLQRMSPESYKADFDKNLASLRLLRGNLRGVRLIANRNMDNVSLDLDEDAMARICAEHAALLCRHYQSVQPTVIDFNEWPFESFGISSVLFDLEYYKQYIKNRIIIDTMHAQGIDNRSFNINALAKSTNPILNEVLREIRDFKNKQAAHTKAALSLSGSATTSNVVGGMDKEIKDMIKGLEDKINRLLTNGTISIFESEALLALILGEDCPMFDSSAVDAAEVTIDDIINEGADFFVHLDQDNARLKSVSQDSIKSIRKRMRNIAVANRERQERLKMLNANINDSNPDTQHLNDNGYSFGGTEYKVNLNIDSVPLEHTYQPHAVDVESVDLSDRFAPVRNQGKQGSCAAFAVSSVIEALRRDSRLYSPAFLYWCARADQNATDTDSGASLYDVIKAAMKNGICAEENMPYNPDIFTLAPSGNATAEALKCTVLEARTVEPKLADIKSALADGFPVIIAARIFDSFSDTRSGFVRHPSANELADGTRSDGHGNHAMVVCGFSDKERILIVRNSWGKEFGKNGYCYLPYSYAMQYILQACIITRISDAEPAVAANRACTIDFNLADSNIEAAILQNLIEEDNYELQNLSIESAKLRTDWAQNIAVLGNANNQAEIVRAAKQHIDEHILNQNSIIAQLQTSMGAKIKEYKKNLIHALIYAGAATLLSWPFVFLFPTSTVAWAIALLLTLVFIGLAGAYSYTWRKYRQELRDEIQRHAGHINRLQQQKTDCDINAHIYGTVLRETERYRLNLVAGFQTLRLFNRAWITLYDETRSQLQHMTPQVPYPFLAVLDNNLLDRYYTAWRHKMTSSIDMHSVFADFERHNDLPLIIKDNSALNNAVTRGLNNFGMKEYLTRTNPQKWQFLPDATQISEVIPDLDARALPFCPYSSRNDSATEKYIFIKDISRDEMSSITRYFAQAPMPVADANPYAISILNIVRYDIDGHE